ncbi:small membrane hydrophobic protein [[Actinomadura] parvosata subsp. kistnae]|uniref:Small membrane hydrophobic protein n=1 Tax=[Actinomadura] parvosata subsp. kistnae TaxID=1909395 RepID=A0A1U9ZXP3_9ACTN|nr:DUF4267 domain-containing protein [Nonomuraea sp. ATCC 55076]AQZ62700.1 small membrane hydrophobic protein [Nonomuraea sp. ATCC 55076]SPL89007.1 small membrane hydrophobic protein [Actinomadura parvosata subsp. kistnae]
MSLKKVNTVLAVVVVLFTLYLGMSFVLPLGTVFPGLPDWPAESGGFNVVKGSREIAMGLAMGVLMVTGQRRALGWVLVMVAVAPFGDMVNVLAHHGSAVAAFAIHGLTAALIAVTGVLILRETRVAVRA